MRTRRVRDEAGYTLLEVMIAAVVLLIGMVGFAATSITATAASRSANQRTGLSLVRGALVDRLTVTPRSALGTLPSTWTIDDCYDGNTVLLAQNATYSSTFTCPTGTAYRGWLQGQSTGTATWRVQLYVETTARGCDPATRYNSSACVATDLYLTD
jgi:prepilin-type N-terminal cleavage/methylation domain-containing protein